MKLLVFSDSHSALGFMHRCVERVKPDVIIHLGDYYDDAQALAESYPHITMYQVAGNCDRHRAPFGALEQICTRLGGVMIFMVHGHTHYVKSGIGALVADARRKGASVALYGHTHVKDCHQEEDGLWVLNPGSCGYGGSAGVLEIQDGKILDCRIITE